MSEVSLRQSTWLVAFARQLRHDFDESHTRKSLRVWANCAPEDRFELWCDAALHKRGLLLGTPTPRWQPDAPAPHQPEWAFLNLLAHQLELLAELRLLYGGQVQGVSDQLILFAVLAAHTGDLATADALMDLTLEDWGPRGDPRRERLARRMTPHSIRLGRRLQEGALQVAHQPLLGLPFHDVLDFASTRQLLTVGQLFFLAQGRPDLHRVPPLLAQTQMLQVHMIEAVIGLALADAKVSRVERRLIDTVIEMARLPEGDRDMVLDALQHPPGAAQLGQWIREPLDRRFLYTQLEINAVIEGQANNPAERGYLDAIADAFHIDRDDRLALQGEALAFLEEHPGLVDAFSLGETLRRFRSGLARRVERAVRHNLGRLVTEIIETGELAALLAKRATGRLAQHEEDKVRSQVIDICKTVPSLALFALPGGAVLLPMVLKLIPNLLPTAFSHKHEKF